MRVISRIAVFLAVFFVVLVLRFPYDALVEKSVRRAELATGATITYQPLSAGPLGVKVANLQIFLPSGASVAFDRAHIYPTRQGLSAVAYQKENEMKISVTMSTISLILANIDLDTGGAGIGRATVSGDLTYGLSTREGKGQLGLKIPELKLPLPISDPSMEVGSSFTIRNVGTAQEPRTGVSAEIKLINKDLTANGTISMQGQAPPAKPLLNGNLSYEHQQFGRGSLQLGGSWDKPTIRALPK